MGKFFFPDMPCGDMGHSLSAVVSGILVSGADYDFCLLHHPVFIVFVEHTPGSADKSGLRKFITSVADINGKTSPLKKIRLNPEIVPLTRPENLSINDFMSHHLLCCLMVVYPFHLANKWGGSCHLVIGLRA
jgi:hypothetical protein